MQVLPHALSLWKIKLSKMKMDDSPLDCFYCLIIICATKIGWIHFTLTDRYKTVHNSVFHTPCIMSLNLSHDLCSILNCLCLCLVLCKNPSLRYSSFSFSPTDEQRSNKEQLRWDNSIPFFFFFFAQLL